MNYEQLKQEAYEVFKTFNIKEATALDDVLVELANFNTEHIEYVDAVTQEGQVDGLIDMIMFAWQLNYRVGHVADMFVSSSVSFLLSFLEDICLQNSNMVAQNIQSVIQSQYQKVYDKETAENLLKHYETIGVECYTDKAGKGDGYLVRSRISQEVNGIEYPKDKILKDKATFVDPVIVL